LGNNKSVTQLHLPSMSSFLNENYVATLNEATTIVNLFCTEDTHFGTQCRTFKP